jgi:lysophospholipid acyltransferase (LPLAT)-like uncharacterized protein
VKAYGRASRFSFGQRIALAIVPSLVAGVVRVLGSTWRVRDVCAEGVAPGHTLAGPTVYAFWHEGLLSCAWRFRGLGIAILISRSFDGELIARTVEKLGFVAVRGSSSRGGAVGLRGMVDAYEAGRICAFTVDGPKGPRRVAKPGAVQLATLAGADWIGCFHAEPVRAWRLGSWDRFAVPLPFTTVRFGWAAQAAPELDAVQRGMEQAVRLAGETPVFPPGGAL